MQINYSYSNLPKPLHEKTNFSSSLLHFRFSIYTDFYDRQKIGAAAAAPAAPVPTPMLIAYGSF